MMNIYLDDMRPCPAGFVPAKTAEECVLLLEAGEVDILSLDYDLGWNQPTGIKVVERMVEKGLYPRRVYLHTSSPAGRMQMYGLLMKHAPSGVSLTNGPMTEAVLNEAAKAKG